MMRMRCVEYRHAYACVYNRDVYYDVLLFVIMAVYNILATVGGIVTF